MSLDDLSSEIGITSEELEFIERSKDASNNLSMIITSKLAEGLRTEPARILFDDYYNRKMIELTPKFIAILKKTLSKEIVGSRTKDHPIDSDDLTTMIFRLYLEEK